MLNIDLKGQVAIVTGVSSGIGQGVAKILARAGCHISGCGTSLASSPGVQKFLDIVNNEGTKANYCSLDVTSSDDLKHLVSQTVEVFGGVDILVSNAGVNVFEGANLCSESQWDFNMNLNLKSHWLVSKMCKSWLEKSDNGVIILMTSNHSDNTIPGCFPYNVSKTAIKGLVQSLAIEWGPMVRTVGLAPGFIDTPGNETWFQSFPDPQEERSRTEGMHPVKKIGTVDEVGGFCAFLASDMASFISGTTYLMDGGRSALMQD